MKTGAGGSGFKNLPAASPGSAPVPLTPALSPACGGEGAKRACCFLPPSCAWRRLDRRTFASFSVCALRRRAQSGCCSPFLAGECTKPAQKGCCSLLPRPAGEKVPKADEGGLCKRLTNTSRRLRLRKLRQPRLRQLRCPSPQPSPPLAEERGRSASAPITPILFLANGGAQRQPCSSAEISWVFCFSRAASARVSTFRRSSGSVLELRMLKRHWPKSALIPSVWSS